MKTFSTIILHLLWKNGHYYYCVESISARPMGVAISSSPYVWKRQKIERERGLVPKSEGEIAETVASLFPSSGWQVDSAVVQDPQGEGGQGPAKGPICDCPRLGCGGANSVRYRTTFRRHSSRRIHYSSFQAWNSSLHRRSKSCGKRFHCGVSRQSLWRRIDLMSKNDFIFQGWILHMGGISGRPGEV